MTTTTKYEYDGQNRCIRATRSDGSQHIWVYNDEGLLVEETIVDKTEGDKNG